jgi:hypothetical protein
MAITLYDPFEAMDFPAERCFLSGAKTDAAGRQVSVFPEWLLDRYSLQEEQLGMLGGNRVKYGDLKLSCSPLVFAACEELENMISAAFTAGYEAVREIPERSLFQWIAKLVYGVLYHDLAYAMERHAIREKEFKLSTVMTRKIRNLHLLLQSLVTPMEFHDFIPWSMQVVKVNYSKDIFNYKDETHNLNFSLGMNGFGIVACLQDMGENNIFQQDITSKIGTGALHPIQFEELCGRFIYSNYLLNRMAEWDIETLTDKIILKAKPFPETAQKPLFRKWDDDMYAQVLSNYWKPWGLTMKDIVTFPNSPVSYLLNELTNELIDPKSIKQPY